MGKSQQSNAMKVVKKIRYSYEQRIFNYMGRCLSFL